MDKINVSLYGDGRKSPLYAEVNYCNNYQNCPLYKQNQCVMVTKPFYSCRCPYGKKERIKGYTIRANKYSAFYNKYKQDALYGKLKSISNDILFCNIGDYYYFNFVYVSVTTEKQDKWRSKYCGKNKTYIAYTGTNSNDMFDKQTMTADVIDDILTYNAVTFFEGQPIKDWKNKTVPNIINDISKYDNDLYKQLIAINPDYLKMAPNYIGRTAYISTLNNNIIIQDCHHNNFLLNNNTLICTDYNGLLPFNANTSTVTIPVTEKMTVEVKDNAWCNTNTKFR